MIGFVGRDDTMEIYQLRYFDEVSKQKSYTRAAEVLAVTQPTLSIAIKKLETELNVTLFEKDGKNTVLTEAGKMLEPIFKSILSDEMVAKRKADEFNKTMITRTRFGIPMDMCDDLYFAVKEAFPADLSCSSVGIAQLGIKDMIVELRENKLDVAMTLKPVEDEGFTYEDYRTFPAAAYMSPDHPYAKSESITPEMMSDTELLISGKNEGLSGAVIRYMNDNLDGGYEPVKRDMVHTHLLLITVEKHGVAIMPEGLDLTGYNVVSRPLNPPLNFEVVVAWKKAKHIPEVQEQLIKFIVNYARSKGYRKDS